MDITKLKALFSSTPNAKLLFETLIGDKDTREMYKDSITVGAAIELFRSEHELSVSRSEVIHIFRQYEDCECGRFITGRRKKPSRFQWAHNLNAIRYDYAEKLDEDKNTSSHASEGAKEDGKTMDLDHQFRLRPNYTVKFELPMDFSGNEASRLAKFIESLPMA